LQCKDVVIFLILANIFLKYFSSEDFRLAETHYRKGFQDYKKLTKEWN
jgi:hypothetical protein